MPSIKTINRLRKPPPAPPAVTSTTKADRTPPPAATPDAPAAPARSTPATRPPASAEQVAATRGRNIANDKLAQGQIFARLNADAKAHGLQTNQDLINHAYRQSAGGLANSETNYGKASEFVRNNYGLEMRDLVARRDARLVVPDDAPPPATSTATSPPPAAPGSSDKDSAARIIADKARIAAERGAISEALRQGLSDGDISRADSDGIVAAYDKAVAVTNRVANNGGSAAELRAASANQAAAFQALEAALFARQLRLKPETMDAFKQDFARVRRDETMDQKWNEEMAKQRELSPSEYLLHLLRGNRGSAE